MLATIALWAWVFVSPDLVVVVKVDDFYDTLERCYWAGTKTSEVWDSLGKRSGYVCIRH